MTQLNEGMTNVERVMKRKNPIVQLVVLAALCITPVASAQQRVFLDFDSGSDGSIVYSTAMRDFIQELMEGHYAGFDVVFNQNVPAAPFSHIIFNDGPIGATAQQIDFRNLDNSDTASVNVDGLGFASLPDIMMASAFMGSHVLGHIQGLRHGDAFGPIGNGVRSGGDAIQYHPDYPGPTAAAETFDHILASPAYGLPLSHLTTPSWFSERSAIRLQFASTGIVVAEAPGPKDSLATAQSIAFEQMVVPNPIVSGSNEGLCGFPVDALTVTGEIGVAGERDFYRFDALAGDLFNFEVISEVINHRLSDTIDSTITILDSLGSILGYYGGEAYNDEELESHDSIIIDLFIPSDGEYYVIVDTFSGVDIGTYELFGYRFNICPADFDCSGSVDVVDLLAVLGAWGTSSGDVTGDDLTNVEDLLAVLGAWGPCS